MKKPEERKGERGVRRSVKCDLTDDDMNIEELKKQICEYHYGYQFKWDELQDHIKISLLEEIIQRLLTKQKQQQPLFDGVANCA